MLKISLKIFVIILGNLFAFLTLGLILGRVFNAEAQWMIIMMVLSILPLYWFLISVMRNFRKESELLYKDPE